MDSKIRKLLTRYGPIGYAIYFHCLELISRDISETNITFELEHDAETIAYNLNIQSVGDAPGPDVVNGIMRYMIDLGLFEEQDGRIYCYKMLYRLDASMTSNPRLRKMITRAKENHDKVMITSCQSHDNIMIESCQSHDKVMLEEKRREEKRRDKKSAYGECGNVMLTDNELEKLKAKFSTYWPLVLSEFSTGKEAKGYKYKNDYAALLRWDFSRVLARPAPARGKHCPRCGSRPMGSEDYCTVCAEDSIAETDDVQHWVDD